MLPSSVDFHNPWLLLLAPLALALLFWRHASRRGKAALVFPSVRRFKDVRPTWRQSFSWIATALEAIAVVGLVVAAARPRMGEERTLVRSQGIAIQMVLDRSSSMEETMSYGDRDSRKIDIVKDVFLRFVEGGGGLTGRKTDLIGLTTFARFTEANCPLVSSYEPLITTVKNLTAMTPLLDRYDRPIAYPRSEADAQRAREQGAKYNPLDRTAIGDGLKRAVLSLVNAEEDLARGEDSGGYQIKGKVIILLTDGKNNAGSDPIEAGALAAANGIKVYFVVFMEPFEEESDIFGRRIKRRLSVDAILEDPRKVVQDTGGKAYLAANGDELLKIYSEIDRIERSEVGRFEFRSFRELYRIPLVGALAALLLAFILKETMFQRVP